MILTIGMIVKNEEKYLERCLNGIKPILEQVDSELIIADTGSTDRTVEIARKFTDNVFYFEWIKDFAAARNSTLEKAQGEWYMFVDADEIFESCDEIIHFFNSGEYKKYNSASYIQRNLMKKRADDNDSQHKYSDFRAPRMTKILPETKFFKPVHEILSTYKAPIKYLDDYAIHYGYSHDDTSNEAQEKFKRNSEILLNRLESEGESTFLYLQLYETYGRFKPQKANEYLDKGIELGVKTNDIITPALFGKKSGSLYGENKYEEMFLNYERYFSLNKRIRPGIIGTDMEMEAGQALALSALSRHEEAIEKYIRFFNLFKDYSSGKLRTDETNTTGRDFAKSANFVPILNQLVNSCIICKRYDIASEYLKKLPIGKYTQATSHIQNLIHNELVVIAHFEYSDIIKYYNRFDENGKKVFRSALFNKLFKARDASPILDFFEKEDDCENLRDPARRVYSIVNRRREGDYKNCISEMRQLIEAYPSLSSVISAYQKEVVAEYENSKPQNEMQQLAAMIKSNIRNYISSGNLPAAEKTLAEYEKINPNDPDIAELKAQLQ